MAAPLSQPDGLLKGAMLADMTQLQQRRTVENALASPGILPNDPEPKHIQAD